MDLDTTIYILCRAQTMVFSPTILYQLSAPHGGTMADLLLHTPAAPTNADAGVEVLATSFIPIIVPGSYKVDALPCRWRRSGPDHHCFPFWTTAVTRITTGLDLVIRRKVSGLVQRVETSRKHCYSLFGIWHYEMILALVFRIDTLHMVQCTATCCARKSSIRTCL